MTPHDFLDALQQYDTLYPFSVTSWKRTPTHNAAKDGVRYSGHKVWLAVDVIYDDGVNLNGASEWAARLGLRRIAENDHDHLQPLDWKKG